MRLNIHQLAQVQSAVERLNRASRYDGLVVGEYRFRLEELVEEVRRVLESSSLIPESVPSISLPFSATKQS